MTEWMNKWMSLNLFTNGRKSMRGGLGDERGSLKNVIKISFNNNSKVLEILENIRNSKKVYPF